MFVRTLLVLLALAGPTVASATGGEVLEAREHRCAALQQRVQQQGSVTLKILFGTLTVHRSSAACNPDTDLVTSPVWRTADERFCIVGQVCSRQIVRLND